MLITSHSKKRHKPVLSPKQTANLIKRFKTAYAKVFNREAPEIVYAHGWFIRKIRVYREWEDAWITYNAKAYRKEMFTALVKLLERGEKPDADSAF